MLPPRTSTICRLPCPLLCPASLWGGVCRCSAMPTVRAATTRPVVVSLATHPPRLVFTVAATSPRHISHKICCSSRTTPNHACVVSIYSVPVLRSFRRFCILIYIRPAPAPPASKQAGSLELDFVFCSTLTNITIHMRDTPTDAQCRTMHKRRRIRRLCPPPSLIKATVGWPGPLIKALRAKADASQLVRGFPFSSALPVLELAKSREGRQCVPYARTRNLQELHCAWGPRTRHHQQQVAAVQSVSVWLVPTPATVVCMRSTALPSHLFSL
jgi:hypothetical protein